ncbi:aminoglycoside 6-adenylyltransferase [Paenibacillus sp. MZ04-78.2]|uniref:aminoglycoside 6-adenylyltransferase n=1 Tax=Paenibacillus sp. MZ04-78.2 TaxID=2962034 RepID=UPI0020B87C32|nr:aminoglycoside 6-adenylyltransferase [Paenibacillus sp. MZ04-78.2]MCP3776336.1 aminoglycoside 6-adenylyltransferase [Paenibacillus sp. MZ04-78.2]
MRSEQEMMKLILDIARNDERIRAVGMNGSRTNPNAPKDIFQDYDIVFIVHDLPSFIEDTQWIDRFGSRIIMQKPEEMKLIPPELDGTFPYLMLFTDGNRIDLTLCPFEQKDNWNRDDKLAVVLLDKDDCLPKLPAPTDEDYWVKRPSAKLFADCCNEFWWVSTYVAKGLWRQEMLYAQDHLNVAVRPMLIQMLEWQVGIQTDFSISTGKNGKYLEKYLSTESWHELLSTFPNATYEGAWQALFAMGDLFRRTAQDVANRLNYEYPLEDDQRVTAYLRHVRNIAPDADQ